MGIGSAVQRGSVVYVYDERNRPLFQRAVGRGPKDGLVGYTANTLSVRVGNVVYTYDTRGRPLGSAVVR